MTYRPKILAFAGSLRKDSLNKKLVQVAALAATEGGADVNYIDLKDYPLPIYDQEIEETEGLPENAKKLKGLMIASDGFLISSPEYNSSIPPVLKNVIDWTSRVEKPGEESLVCFKGKVISLMSASPSPLGGIRGLVEVRSIFGNIMSIVLPAQKCMSVNLDSFNADGTLKDPKQQKDAQNLGKDLVEFLKKLKGNQS